jgi:serine/threonine protein kinase
VDETLGGERYEDLTSCGDGQNALVFRAFDKVEQRDVAIRFLIDADELILRSEVEKLQKIDHENVVSVYDVTRLTNPTSRVTELCIVLEFIDGGTLSHLLPRGVTPALAHILGHGVISGVEAVHGSGIVMGDLHDKNVMYSALKQQIKIIDPGGWRNMPEMKTGSREATLDDDLLSIGKILQKIIWRAGGFEIAAVFDEETKTAKSFGDWRAALERAIQAARDKGQAT